MELFLWILVGFLFFNSLSDRKKVKRLQTRLKKLQKTTKGENQMSVLLKELVGSKAKIRFDEEFSITYEYTILAVDEEWVKISRELANRELETKLVRVDNIVDLSF
ncbi:hypothetical protein [Streptococcus suis]|uniref:Uncharacterized protein n=1 Tax=Streptococcus suis D12 TaxID=1004952 RepID=G7SDW8_STRSU|nr:hypothetical protein [Streptococcus suis]AER19042.1 hypothetical protein SSUD12_0725 [Streptococcus suis D12]HEM4813477.1 hypothetical protein [Streptococcus suis]HEM4879363.1 hypothetical protein [Streptococcus suis]HEM4918586.1 hypothetical protein [Streptococcus suis]HEM4948260.1 hypothetical protein [Streptococcus suis]